MKVDIWAKRAYGPTPAKGKLVWTGEMDSIPRVDEYIVVYDGWGAERVHTVFYNLYDNSVMIEIGPDYQDEYPGVEHG